MDGQRSLSPCLERRERQDDGFPSAPANQHASNEVLLQSGWNPTLHPTADPAARRGAPGPPRHSVQKTKAGIELSKLKSLMSPSAGLIEQGGRSPSR